VGGWDKRGYIPQTGEMEDGDCEAMFTQAGEMEGWDLRGTIYTGQSNVGLDGEMEGWD
jgi:hypothetical protein